MEEVIHRQSWKTSAFRLPKKTVRSLEQGKRERKDEVTWRGEAMNAGHRQYYPCFRSGDDESETMCDRGTEEYRVLHSCPDQFL
jgi:hypothetical protein